jgi:hypothetical protein
MRRPGPRAVTCSCGQVGNERPGFRLEEYEHLEAVIVENDAGLDMPGVLVGPDLPQRLVCNNCGRAQPVPRGSIEVRPAKKGA